MPEVIKVKKGTQIQTEDGIVVVPGDTNLWNQGYVETLLRRINEDNKP